MYNMKNTVETRNSIVTKRPIPSKYGMQHMYIDRGYDFAKIEWQRSSEEITCRTSDAMMRRRMERIRGNDNTKEGDGLQGGQIHGIIVLESCLRDMRRNERTTWISTIRLQHYCP
jgi:hypothetical protein